MSNEIKLISGIILEQDYASLQFSGKRVRLRDIKWKTSIYSSFYNTSDGYGVGFTSEMKGCMEQGRIGIARNARKNSRDNLYDTHLSIKVDGEDNYAYPFVAIAEILG